MNIFSLLKLAVIGAVFGLSPPDLSHIPTNQSDSNAPSDSTMHNKSMNEVILGTASKSQSNAESKVTQVSSSYFDPTCKDCSKELPTNKKLRCAACSSKFYSNFTSSQGILLINSSSKASINDGKDAMTPPEVVLTQNATKQTDNSHEFVQNKSPSLSPLSKPTRVNEVTSAGPPVAEISSAPTPGYNSFKSIINTILEFLKYLLQFAFI